MDAKDKRIAELEALLKAALEKIAVHHPCPSHTRHDYGTPFYVRIPIPLNDRKCRTHQCLQENQTINNKFAKR